MKVKFPHFCGQWESLVCCCSRCWVTPSETTSSPGTDKSRITTALSLTSVSVFRNSPSRLPPGNIAIPQYLHACSCKENFAKMNQYLSIFQLILSGVYTLNVYTYNYNFRGMFSWPWKSKEQKLNWIENFSIQFKMKCNFLWLKYHVKFKFVYNIGSKMGTSFLQWKGHFFHSCIQTWKHFKTDFVIIYELCRTKDVDWMPFFSQRLVDDFASHLRLYRRAREHANVPPTDGKTYSSPKKNILKWKFQTVNTFWSSFDNQPKF